MNISEVLQNVELDDEQIKVLDEFFESYTNDLKIQIEDDLRDEITEEVISDLEITKEDAEEAFKLFEADVEQAFEMFEEDTKKAFKLFEDDAEKASDLVVEDVKKEYAENLSVALQDLYDDVESRVKSDFFESKEFKAIEKIKEAIAPFVLNEDQKVAYDKIVEKQEELIAKEQEINEASEKLERDQAIELLVADIPNKFKQHVIDFISEGESVEDIYSRFDSALNLIKEGIDGEDENDDDDDDDDSYEVADDENENVDDDIADDDDEDDLEEEKTADKKKNKYYGESFFNVKHKTQKSKNLQDDEDLLNLIFPQAK